MPWARLKPAPWRECPLQRLPDVTRGAIRGRAPASVSARAHPGGDYAFGPVAVRSGGVAEWTNAAVLKTVRRREASRGFESHPLRWGRARSASDQPPGKASRTVSPL
jgi:hypothetical protein